jgi:hypothetical protein
VTPGTASSSSPIGTDFVPPAKREIRRLRVRALALLVALYLFVVVVLSALTMAGVATDWWGAALFLGFALIAPLEGAFMWPLARRQFLPGLQTIRWANGSAEAHWRAIDGKGSPADIDSALARLAGREDDDAVATRVSVLASGGSTADLRKALDAWKPTDPMDLARRERAASALRLLEGVDDGLETAWATGSTIPDSQQRVGAQANTLISRAIRMTEAGRDPFASLAQAHDLLGDRVVEFETDDDRRATRRARLKAVAFALVPTAIVTIIAVAAWNGVLG